MNVSCPSCSTVFRVDPAKVPEGGVRARCTVCKGIFRVVGELLPEFAPVRPAPAPAVGPSPLSPPAEMVATPPVTAPSAPPASRTTAPPTAPVVTPRQQPAVSLPPAAPPAPPATRPPVRPAADTVPAPPPPSAPAQPRPRSGAPINPFLAQDPKQKARRLARALVSDLVVYHPDKRQEGLRNGNLKELFDDEIKKSWEEYTEQIGPDVSDATTYFTDALNEILGDGSRIF